MLTLGPMKLIDISGAEESVIRVVQGQVYGKELEALKKTKGKGVSIHSILLQ